MSLPIPSIYPPSIRLSLPLYRQIYKSLSSELKELVESGKVRIEIISLSQGSVVVNFSIVYDASVTELNVSSAVLGSLLNSTRYSVDEHSTSVSGMYLSLHGPGEDSWAVLTPQTNTRFLCSKPNVRRLHLGILEQDEVHFKCHFILSFL